MLYWGGAYPLHGKQRPRGIVGTAAAARPRRELSERALVADIQAVAQPQTPKGYCSTSQREAPPPNPFRNAQAGSERCTSARFLVTAAASSPFSAARHSSPPGPRREYSHGRTHHCCSMRWEDSGAPRRFARQQRAFESLTRNNNGVKRITTANDWNVW